MIHFPYLPVEGLHEFNLDWFLNRFKELSDEWDETKAAWLALKEWVENYFEDTDFIEKIENALDKMYEDGRLAEVMARIIGNSALPVFVDEMGDMTNTARVYVLKSTGMIYYWNGSTWQPTGLIYPEAKSTISSSNIVLTADNMQGYTTPNDFANNQIYAFTAGAWKELSDMPLYSMPQDGVIITYVNSSTTSSPAKIQILTTPNHAYTRFKWGTGEWGKWQYLKGGMLITPTSDEGVTDINNVANNTTYMIQSNVTEERLKNLPRYGLNGTLTSYGYGGTVTDDNAGALQTYTTERFTYYRMKWAGTWGAWHKSTTNDYIQAHGNATFSDANLIQPNSISLIMGNITEEDISGLPRYGIDGWLITLSYLDTPDINNFLQIFITGWNIYFRFKINGTVYPWRVWGMQTNNLLFLQSTDMTGYPDYQNCNTFPLMSYVIASVTSSQIQNMPIYQTPVFIMTYGNRDQSQDGRFQVAYCLQTSDIFYRFSWAGSWTEWKNVSGYQAYRQNDFINIYNLRCCHELDKPTVTKLRGLTLGDSLTTSQGDVSGSRTILSDCTFMLGKRGLYTATSIKNYGAGGATILDNLETQVNNLISTENLADTTTDFYIMILMGTNDITNGYDMTEVITKLWDCLRTLYNATKANRCPIVYVSPLPRHSGGQNGLEKKNAILTQNVSREALRSSYNTIHVINGLNMPVTMTTNTQPYDSNFIPDTADGVHPNLMAKSIIARHIACKLWS